MPYDVLVNEAKNLTDDQIMQVIAFARFLRHESIDHLKKAEDPGENQGWIRKPGILAGKLWMADDFDETPEGFEEYI
ncbi:MAG: DUF2281 domain-containing protein [Oscillospiraceae bacterium]|nr:DUF2281 domain-containing protein [Oscillospiraceae bacterium]